MAISLRWATGSRLAQRLVAMCRAFLKQIRERGFEPAIWVAPFVAEEKSNVFQQHPDWFVKDADGKPLRSDRVTFGGWRRGPWYVLDGTHPEVQQHFEKFFRMMKRDWGCTYFKLDANFWGAIHGGRFYDPRATRIEAYRRGMQAILRGVERQFCAWLQSSDLAFARIDSRIAKFERHQAHLGTHRDHRASESESQLAKRTALVERFRCDSFDRRSAGQRVSVSRDGDLCVRWDAFVG